MSTIRIIKAGLLTTLQDAGRKGYQQYGIPVAGGMDLYSLQLANILVGNDPDEAALEITIFGPRISFLSNTTIAFTGGDFPLTLNGVEVRSYETVNVQAGDELLVGAVKKGCRGYLAIRGGFEVPLVMGSKSTYLRGGFGGYQGRQLKDGDEIPIQANRRGIGFRRTPDKMIPKYEDSFIARVILGPEAHRFTSEGIDTFLREEYTLTNQCDRMGYRVEGPVIQHTNGADIISAGVNLGAIQIPGDGKPIIMMADRQTTGGYTKIANVISVDIPYLAQLKPGNKIRFKSITLEEAQQLLLEQNKCIDELEKSLNDKSLIKTNIKKYNIRVKERNYEVLVEEII